MEEKTANFRPVFTASNIKPFIDPQPFASPLTGKPTLSVVSFLNKFQPFKGWKEENDKETRRAQALKKQEDAPRAYLEPIENKRILKVEGEYDHPWNSKFTDNSIQEDIVDLNTENNDIRALESRLDILNLDSCSSQEMSWRSASLEYPVSPNLKQRIPRKAREKLNLDEINKDFNKNF